ncbi:type VI secretion protein [Pseudomonas coronafaciens pv. porri]|uniref:Type VI secretion protein n=1 Tax=Pseudomonas coronafaciens pv. porri TaxID=83964 RepID=A0ABR5JTI8_9PSED|nr:type VI secretion system lipoprotein TssJ [Pseudomonas coronafaciens]KOP60707.1 type VI secretion protein [Pseudomonas coronafaciens pv. porri]RMU80582.1 hypothetical protein ALP22_00386 [Pseudomonas coronafaciens pv. porri]
MRFFFRRLPLLLLLSLLAGCSVLSPYSKQTRLDISVIADNQLNPDINGRPSPVVIKLLELKRPTTAESMDFFSLYQRTEDVLANDLAASEIVELRPGDRIELKLKLHEGSRYFAVLAAYRSLSETRWRHVIQVSPGQQNRAVFLLGESGIYRTDNRAHAGNSL